MVIPALLSCHCIGIKPFWSESRIKLVDEVGEVLIFLQDGLKVALPFFVKTDAHRPHLFIEREHFTLLTAEIMERGDQDDIYCPRSDIVEKGSLLWVLSLIVDGNDLPPPLCCVRTAFTELRGKALFDTFIQLVGQLLDIDGNPWSLLQSFASLLVG